MDNTQLDKNLDYAGRFEETWANARKWYRIPESMRNEFLCVYLWGRIDGMAYLTDKRIDRMSQSNAVRKHVKDSMRNMEGM